MAYADQQMSGNKITALIIVAIIHIVVGYALVTGLAYEAAQKVIQKVTTIDIEEEVKKEEEPPPPPPKKMDMPPPPVKVVVPPSKIDISPPKAPPIDTTPIPPPPPPPLPPPPAAPPPPRFTPKGPTPNNQRSWAARIQDNYPSRAIREQREGRVGVRVQISAEGRVTSCTVTNPSGSSDLDSAACEGMQRYARYNPATNSDGEKVSGTANTTIVYRLQ